MSRRTLVACGLAVVLSGSGWAQVTSRVSLSTSGTQGNADSRTEYIDSPSPDGRFVVFVSNANNLVGGDSNGRYDIFVRDREGGVTERVSAPANNDCFDGSISADGRYVAFSTASNNLVGGDTNASDDVFVRDRLNGTTERVSVDSSGAQANTSCSKPSISADGRYVTFESTANNLVSGDTNASNDIFVHDRQTGATERVSIATGGAQGNATSLLSSISADGRYVAFESGASNFVLGDTNDSTDTFVHDRQSGTTERVSVATGGAQASSSSTNACISADGRYVAFMSFASELASGDTNGTMDVFVHDRQSGMTERTSIATGGVQANEYCGVPSISADGRYVAFMGSASNLVPGDTNGGHDVFVRDRLIGTTERMSIDSAGVQGNSDSTVPLISADGRYVVFQSQASNLVHADTNGTLDVFVRDRLGGTGFTSLCVPGSGGVISCPCSNPPGGFGQGCDNSSATGGALLSASGGTYLSSDSLVLVALGERPTALSIVLQGNVLIPSGAVYGQGVRCAGGALKRLYTRTASGGIVEAPDFAAGDPSVSAQSAAKGDPISAGQSRWYLVYYRDPIVLGGCPSSSTFNATQTGEVLWSP